MIGKICRGIFTGCVIGCFCYWGFTRPGVHVQVLYQIGWLWNNILLWFWHTLAGKVIFFIVALWAWLGYGND